MGNVAIGNLKQILRTLVEASVDTGIATGAGVNYLDDTAKSWPDNAFADLIVEITGGTGVGQIRKIASNTATRITVTPDWVTVPDATSTYRIGFYGKMSGDITSWGGVAVTGRDITQDIAKLDITLSALRDAITAAAPNSKTLNDLYVQLGKLLPQENDYDYVEIDLGTARTDAALGLSGTSLTVKDLTGTASVRFNSTTKPLVPLAKGEVYQVRFAEVYLTNAAQDGQSLKLFVGRVG